jgi:predicted MFS family arabinose efflux permease
MLLAMATPPAMQYSIGVLAPFLVADAGVTRVQVGLYTSVLFVISAVVSPLLGVVVDRFNSRLVLSVGFGFGAGSALLAAAADSYAWVLASALAAGVPMAMSNPVTNRLVRGFVPAGSRGRLMGVKQSGVMVAQTVVGFAAGPLAALLGWRYALLPALGIAVCGLLVAWSAVPVLPAAARHVGRSPRPGVPPTVRWLAVYAMFMGSGQAVVGAYLPLYAYERVGVSPATAGLAVGMFGVVAALSRIGWAPAAERASWFAVPLRLVALGALPGVICIAAAESLGAPALLIGAAVYGATAPVWNVPGMLAVFRLVGAEATGRASGLIYMGFSYGFVAGPIGFALLVESAGYRTAWLALTVPILAALLTTTRLAGPPRS